MDGQGAQIVQQVGDLLTQLAQQETEPSIQRALMRIMKELDPVMNLVAADDQQDMSSGLATPNGPPDMGQGPGGPAPGGAPPDFAGALGGGPGAPGAPPGGPPPDFGGNLSSEGPLSELDRSTQSGPSRSFRGANKAAMQNLREKGSFSRSGSKETERAKNRREGGRSLSQGRK